LSANYLAKVPKIITHIIWHSGSEEFTLICQRTPARLPPAKIETGAKFTATILEIKSNFFANRTKCDTSAFPPNFNIDVGCKEHSIMTTTKVYVGISGWNSKQTENIAAKSKLVHV
jgi:hypothetical protein